MKRKGHADLLFKENCLEPAFCRSLVPAEYFSGGFLLPCDTGIQDLELKAFSSTVPVLKSLYMYTLLLSISPYSSSSLLRAPIAMGGRAAQLGFRSPSRREGGWMRRSSTATGEEKRRGYDRRCLVVEKRTGSRRRRPSVAIPPRWLRRTDWRGRVLGRKNSAVCVLGGA